MKSTKAVGPLEEPSQRTVELQAEVLLLTERCHALCAEAEARPGKAEGAKETSGPQSP